VLICFSKKHLKIYFLKYIIMRLHEKKRIDVKELLNREALNQEFNKSRLSDKYGVSDQYILLDSFIKAPESKTENGEFHWKLIIQEYTSEDVIGLKNRIDDIIEIQIGQFNMPILQDIPYNLIPFPSFETKTDQLILIKNNNNTTDNYPTLVANNGVWGQYPNQYLLPPETYTTPWISNPYSQVPFSNTFTIQIKEAGLQSFSGKNGTHHHFELKLLKDDLSNTLIATSQHFSNWDKYIFTDPIKNMHSITLVFRNPDNPLTFLPDCLYDAIVENDGLSFIRIRYENHRLCVGDRIFIKKFKSNNLKLNSYMNRNEGHVVSGDPSNSSLNPGQLITGNYFWTDPAINISDLTIQTPGLPKSATIQIAKRRLRIPLRIRSLTNYITNFMTI